MIGGRFMFPRKGTRKIVIDNIEYLWRVSDEEFYLILSCRRANENASIIEVSFLSGIGRYCTEFPKVYDLQMSYITPRIVRSIVLQAIHLGWVPVSKGPVIRYNYDSDTNHLEESSA